jgi:fibronectin type 3 domain-containing protein
MPRQLHQEQDTPGEGTEWRNIAKCIWVLVLFCLLFGCGYKTRPRPATATIPGEIGLLTARAYPDKIVLRWDVPASNATGSPATDISGFKVWRLAQKIGEECENCEDKRVLYANVDFQNPSNAVIEKGEVIYTDGVVTSGNIYNYAVSVYNFKGREGRQSQDVTVVMEEPPPPPENVRADFDSRGAILEWDSPPRLSGIKNYRIYRSETDSDKDMKSIGGTRWAERNFVDKDVEKQKTYYYQVRSLKESRGIPMESAPSETVSVKVPAVRWQPPENVKTTISKDGIRVYWDPVKIEGHETRYNVYRSETEKAPAKINSEPISYSSVLDNKVRRGNTYRYAVTAFPQDKPEEESSRSASGSAKFVY